MFPSQALEEMLFALIFFSIFVLKKLVKISYHILFLLVCFGHL